MSINILPPIVANQIAAGEVVNRPASVVKELMENSIDAGADNISLIIENAGRQLVQVTDNGCGMNEEDCKKCFLAHATSKISKVEDLHNLYTMGFRGEALASMAAIAQVELKSKREDDDLGTKVIIEGGQEKATSPISCKKGTDIKVKNIFFNVPARRNFLKSDQVELSHITNEFLRIAIIHNDISFSFYNNGKVVYKLEKASFKKRIVDIFGDSFNKNLLPVEENVDIVKVKGFVSSASLTRKNKNEQYFFVNKRFMKNSYLANAVERAYQGLLQEKNFPLFFISLEVEPKNIDVNIHPTKTEIKFLDDKLIYSVLYATVRKSLGQTLNSNLDFTEKEIVFPAKQSKNFSYQPNISFNKSYNPFANGFQNDDFSTPSFNDNPLSQTEITFSKEGIKQEKTEDNFDAFQFLNKYIVVKMQGSILIIDQHRASKNIIYHKLSLQEDLEIVSQRLLMPINIKFSPADNYKVLDNKERLENLGIELSYKNDGSFDVVSMPVGLSAENISKTIEEYIYSYDTEIENQEEKQRYNLSIAERLAIKYDAVLNKEEIIHLIAELFKLPSLETLPNGDKVILKVDENYLNLCF
ncbi:MAG: DNA mismatch repair endonuclease MutL [Bacteroidales bacterium]|nr:DNA mismatch repair endonuclease MutL [Bacteroidales bacterium]